MLTMRLPLLTASVLSLLLSGTSAAQCVTSGFRVKDLDECSFDALLKAFTPIFNDPVNRSPGCSSTSAEQDLIALLNNGGSTSNKSTAKTVVQQVCAQGIASHSSTVPFADIPGYGESFITNFFNGGTHWNTMRETSFPLDANGETTSVLKQDASQVKSFYEGKAQYGLVQWPDQLPNFSECEMNTAYCCWTTDRQADDNNGNCAMPYDENCVDADPADNTDLCFVDVAAGSATFGKTDDGTFFFPHDDHNNQNEIKAEGPIHCHGVGWADNVLDPSAVYKGNNLFYVSMYDHMYKRGYVRNVPGAPMCGCAEQMPVVSRSDCTQLDVVQQFEITYDGTSFEATLAKTDIDFNACEGLDRYGEDDSNDLWSYMNRLYVEDKITAEKLLDLNTKLVGDDDNMCQFAMNKHMAEKGFAVGHQSSWTQLAGREALAMETPIGQTTFMTLLEASSSKILKRICPYCYVSHRNVFYKRLTPVPQDFDLLGALLFSNEAALVGNTWGTDFEMYSTFDDATEGVNAWTCPSGVYKGEAGFPGDCGPTGETTNQHSLYNHGHWGGQMDTAWYIDASSPFTTLSSTLIGDPPEWFHAEVVASLTEANGRLYMTSNAVDIWGTADNLQFYSDEHAGDIEVIVRLEEFQYLSAWSKTGILIRESTMAPGSKYFALLVSGENGVYSQWRETTNDATRSNAQMWDGSEPFTSPIWLRVLKQGDLFTAYQSADGSNWEMRTSMTIPMAGSVHAGLGLAANHWSQDVAEAIFSNYEKNDYYWPSAVPSSSPAPSTYTILSAYNVGNPNTSYPGKISLAANSNKYVVTSAGNIGGKSDSFYFAPVQKTGAFTVTTFIESFDSPVEWARSALMIRDPGQDGANVQVSCVLQNEHGLYMFARKSSGGETEYFDVNWHNEQTSGWCKLEKSGNTVTGYRSFDGINWDKMETITVGFTSDVVDVGVAASGAWNEYSTAVFANFKFS
mmetsp:Transcript_29125/g.48153  ORF Transcript_29125/g.48153 Transcript_29125/m.48153 type:complete len:966 (-) Transcript_29125:190-3087(-)